MNTNNFIFIGILLFVAACQPSKTYTPTAESCAKMKMNEDHEFWNVPTVKAYCLALIDDALFQQSLEDNAPEPAKNTTK